MKTITFNPDGRRGGEMELPADDVELAKLYVEEGKMLHVLIVKMFKDAGHNLTNAVCIVQCARRMIEEGK